MKDKIVINIGYDHAGTTSLNEAMNILGYSSINDVDYNGIYDNINNNRNIFDGFIPKHNAFTNYPFLDENILEIMIEQYPEEYYVYTKRNYRDMYKSARVIAGRGLLYPYKGFRRRPPLFKIWLKKQKEKQLYIETVLKNNLNLKVLEFNVCDEGHGWKELCGFLNKKIPNVNFPHLNKSKFTWGRGHRTAHEQKDT